MKFLGITQRTANWLLSNTDSLNVVANEIQNLTSNKAILDGVIAVGALRITGDKSTQLVCIWNTDYLTGTFNEEWGFLKMDSPLGLFDAPDIYKEVIEHELIVINQRLQGLMLPEGFKHRPHENNISTCLAGRGEIAWHQSIGYFEDVVPTNAGRSRSIVCVGPSSQPGFDTIKRITKETSQLLQKLVITANNLLLSSLHRPALDISAFIGLKNRFAPESAKENSSGIIDAPKLDGEKVDDTDRYTTYSWTYEDWLKPTSPLTKTQRFIIETDLILKQPVRIVGAAGSGKSLLMQLMAMRLLSQAKINDQALDIMYIVHNSEMENTIWNKFDALGGAEFLFHTGKQRLLIKTLFEYSRTSLSLSEDIIIDKDAYQTKEYQKQIVKDSMQRVYTKQRQNIDDSPLFSKVFSDDGLIEIFSELICSEIGIAIKGRSLASGKKVYIESEQPFTRLHGVLTPQEREIVFDIFQEYHNQIFEQQEVLDSDDVALTFLSSLRTALWEMKRKKAGFDFLLVDEAQLFNQNERQLFRLLTKTSSGYLPIAIALDEAQDIYGAQNVGLGLLGFDNLANETLSSIHRSTPSILKLAFFVIQRTTDLFGTDFPNFTVNSETTVDENHTLAAPPRLIVESDAANNLGKSILKEIRDLRKNNIWQIAVVVHSEHYWDEVSKNLEKQNIPLAIHTRRGEMIDPKAPIVVLTRPENIGGQEFEAVISVGLEKGLVPPLVDGNVILNEALEQQSLREMYLVFTRAKYRLIIFNAKNSQVNHTIEAAIQAGLIQK